LIRRCCTTVFFPLARVIRSGEGFQSTRIGESRAVVADFGEYAGTGQFSETGKTGDNRSVGVPFELRGSGVGQFGGRGAGCIELDQ
jgi:hypothetical protein